MSDESTTRAPQPANGHGGLRLLALGAVAFGVLLLAAAAFVLSYAGIHAVALSAGVSPRLARIYPLIFDAMLVVSGAAVLSLRGAGLPSRAYAWLSMLVLLAAAAAADALHATGSRIPRRPAAATAAVIPWALVLIGFGLLLCMLRQGRLRRAAAAAAQQEVVVPEPSGHVAVRPTNAGRPAQSTSIGEGRARIVPDHARSRVAPDLAPDLAIDSEPSQDDPSSDEAGSAEQPELAEMPRWVRDEQAAGYGGRSASAYSPAPTLAQPVDPEANEATPDAESGPEPGLGADARLEAEADLEAEARLETDAGLEAEAGRQPEPLIEPESDPEAGSEAEFPAGADAVSTGEAEVWPEAEPTPATPQFERKRSSPVPPGT